MIGRLLAVLVSQCSGPVPRSSVLRLVVAGLLLVGAVLGVPAGPAGAHASFVKASPAPGRGLVQAPGDVVIRFSEPLVRDLSRIEVVDRTGTDVTRGPTQPVQGDDRALRRPLRPLPPGGYTVRWTTVSPLDGHTLKGSYTFAVGTGASPTDTVADGPVDSEGWLGLFGRLAALGGLTLWLGIVLVGRRAVAAGAPRRPLTVLRRGAPLAVGAGTLASLVSGSLVASGSLAGLDSVVLASASGRWRLLLVAVAGVAAAWSPSRSVPRVLLAGVAAQAEAASGHAASSPVPVLATASFAVHLAAVGVWVTAVVAALLAEGHRRSVLARMSPWAIGAASVVGLTGVANAAIELQHPSDLVNTGYGRAVLAKAVAFGLMAAFGALHARRRRRASARGLEFPLRAELSAAFAALLVATLLVGFPNPPADAAGQRAAVQGTPLARAVEGRAAVSVATASGRLTIGLTLGPPRPGVVEASVRVLGLEAGDALREATLGAEGPGGRAVAFLLRGCGFGCYRGAARIDTDGRWTFRLSFASNLGPVRVAYDIPLPAADGRAELAHMYEAMRAVTSATVEEALSDSTDGRGLTSVYTFSAPNRMRWAVQGGSTRIAIGRQGYQREKPDASWEAYRWPGSGFAWPGAFYDGFFAGAEAVRIIGRDDLRGVPALILGFVQPEYPAWYRLWIGVDDGRLYRLEMRAERHIMDQTFVGYGEPVSIQPPPLGREEDRPG